jgi:protein-S-isoprenylcysteine O-methyltransferase Ste14
MRLLGMSLAMISFVLWATARVQLGKSFSVKPKAVAIVSRGIYSKIRNPIYVFSTLWIVGFILALGRPKWLLILVLLVPMQVARARREARLLKDTFGDSYREYREKTWF